MSPSRGATSDGAEDEAVRTARCHVRHLLAAVHILEALPDRSRMLAVDAKLPVHCVLTTVLSEQHPHPQQRPSNSPGTDDAPAAGMGMRREGAGAGSAGQPAEEGSWKLLCCGPASPALPTNVLAEVSNLDAANLGRPVGDAGPPPAEDGIEEKTPSMRRMWTSPDDGWGTHLILSDLERMPMGMPLTVGELADFLAHACEDKTSSEMDMLDWSLSQWRLHRLKATSTTEKKGAGSAAEEGGESASRLELDEGPHPYGPVLVHHVPCAPPRPILLVDDPEATLLKAVQLLLAYPNLDAIPVVSPVRCAVVAHLTLSYCLAFMLSRLRGAELQPLAELKVGWLDGPEDSNASPEHKKFCAAENLPSSQGAEGRSQEKPPVPWVLCSSQPLQELLHFFAQMHHTAVPVVDDANGGLLGLFSRRDLLAYLDLAMQCAERGPPETPDAATETVSFNVAEPVEAVLKAVNKFRAAHQGEAVAGTSSQATPGFFGAALVYEKELPVKTLLLRVLEAQNRKVLFVEGCEGELPRLRRILSAADAWRLLIGSDKEALAGEFSPDKVIAQGT
eukprot:TRINITY_DN16086_c0_g1_i2.p1 TRINITY_DN16086_c0_g1~~TRINITY_DN16086_c0_g1_i2.p1  ORF type:complete len:563 (+),score=127.68 TRINITY_DN16086_c0_g1_i2:62-1750(+)